MTHPAQLRFLSNQTLYETRMSHPLMHPAANQHTR